MGRDKASRDTKFCVPTCLVYTTIAMIFIRYYIPDAGGAGSSGFPAFFNGIWIRT